MSKKTTDIVSDELYDRAIAFFKSTGKRKITGIDIICSYEKGALDERQILINKTCDWLRSMNQSQIIINKFIKEMED